MCAATNYAIQRGADTDSDFKTNGRKTCWWWLRSSGDYYFRAAYASKGGSIDYDGTDVNSRKLAVRPCVRVLFKPQSYYQNAISLMKEEKYEEAIEIFRVLNGYSDSEAQIEACETAILEREYQKAVSLMTEEKYEEAIEIFRALNGYSDSAAQIKACETTISEREYQKAEKFRKSGQYAEAYAIYTTIRSYKDVDEIIMNDVGVADAQRAAYQPGKQVIFGTYPQTKSGTDDTPIKWLVLESDGETALLISCYALDSQPYNTNYTSITWEQCTLRSWLNDEFYNRAFSEDEKQSILTSEVSADKNLKSSANPGNATKDNVFLLSIAEADKYFTSDESRMCSPTSYAIKQGAYTNSDYKVHGMLACCWWWLRSPGENSVRAANVISDGSVNGYGSFVQSDDRAVRPCVRIRFSGLPTDTRTDYADGEKQTEERSDQTTGTAEYQVGDYVTFGSYPQTESGTDKTPIEWLVLENDGATALLISRYALDRQPYNNIKSTSITWEQSSLRSWLNNVFYNRAFSNEEKQSILMSDVSADKNPNCDTNPGKATKDSVFLLSGVEAEKYFTSDGARMCAPTDYAVQRGARINSNYKVDGKGTCSWWLRSPGIDGDRATVVGSTGSFDGYDSTGSFGGYGSIVYDSDVAVRPCVRVQLVEPMSYYQYVPA